MNTQHTLNNLLSMTINSVHGYTQAAEGIDNAALTQKFSEIAARRQVFVEELSAEITRLGGTPTDSGTLAGAMHRAWLDIKALVTNGNEAAILEAAAFGEGELDKAYEQTLTDGDFTAELTEILERQHAFVHETSTYIADLQTAHETA